MDSIFRRWNMKRSNNDADTPKAMHMIPAPCSVAARLVDQTRLTAWHWDCGRPAPELTMPRCTEGGAREALESINGLATLEKDDLSTTLSMLHGWTRAPRVPLQ